MEEARASLNFFGITRKGWNVQFTLRDEDEAALMDRFAAFVLKLEESHVVPKPVGQQVTTPPPPASALREAYSDAPGQAQSAPPTVSTPPAAAAHPDGPLTFQAVDMVGSTSQGRTYWKVRGGQFTKFGVTIWPETLKAAGFDMDALDPAEVYDLTGYKAFYILNAEKSTPEKEVPEKVVALTK